jgi:hypothetical protein
MFTSIVVVVMFYVICYFTPNLCITFLKNREEIGEMPIQGFHKLNTLLFLFVLLTIVTLLILMYILILLVTIATGKGSISDKFSLATSRYIEVLWDNGKMMNIWVSLTLAIFVGYSLLSLYFLLSPEEVIKKINFRLKTNNDEDDVNYEDEVWQTFETTFRMFLAVVMAIFLYSLALQSLYFSKTSTIKYSNAILYLLAMSALFISLEWSFTIVIFIALVVVSSWVQ